jgi:hypothetical protein
MKQFCTDLLEEFLHLLRGRPEDDALTGLADAVTVGRLHVGLVPGVRFQPRYHMRRLDVCDAPERVLERLPGVRGQRVVVQVELVLRVGEHRGWGPLQDGVVRVDVAHLQVERRRRQDSVNLQQARQVNIPVLDAPGGNFGLEKYHVSLIASLDENLKYFWCLIKI